jgi:hypothetical protein
MNRRFKQRNDLSFGIYSGQCIDEVFSMYWPQNEHQTDIYGQHLCETPFEALVLALRQTYKPIREKKKLSAPVRPFFYRRYYGSPERMERALSVGAELFLKLGTESTPTIDNLIKNLDYYERLL